MTIEKMEKLSQTLRFWILQMTTAAGSGHVTSSLSAADLMAVLLNHFCFDYKDLENLHNDHIIFSKGHASPLYYAMFACMGAIGFDELWRYRQIDSNLEGHPTPRFKFADFATGSLGQGLGEAAGLAFGLSKRKSSAKVWVLLGDGELAEGSVWESAAFVNNQNLNNLIAIVDVNGLGQSRATSVSNIKTYQERFAAFGWDVFIVDGHNIQEIENCFDHFKFEKPTVVLAKTTKGKGVSFLENQVEWHGKALNKQELDLAMKEFDNVESNLTVQISPPKKRLLLGESQFDSDLKPKLFELGEKRSLRKEFGETLAELAQNNPNILVLDGDVANSTFTSEVEEKTPMQFVENFIAEQQMVEGAVGLSKIGFIPVAATFAAFLTRAFDQIRMAAVSKCDLTFVGTHAGVSIGEDGPSQMGLEDVAMFSTIDQSKIMVPADAVAARKILPELINQAGIKYLRLIRPEVPVIYSNDEKFVCGGSKVLRESNQDCATVVASGVTVTEALKAYDMLAKDQIFIKVIDAYSIKPIDRDTLIKAASQTKCFVVVEDHRESGGLGDAVLNVFADEKMLVPHVIKLAVSGIPQSGKSDQLMNKYSISAKNIYDTVKGIAN